MVLFPCQLPSISSFSLGKIFLEKVVHTLIFVVQSSLKTPFRFDSYSHINTSFTTTSVQFSSVTQACLTLRDPMNRSTPGLPVRHQLPEFTQTQATAIFPGVTRDCVIILLKSFQRPWEVWMIKTILPGEHRPITQVRGQGSRSVGEEPSPSLGGFFAQQPPPHHFTTHWTEPFHFLFWSL